MALNSGQARFNSLTDNGWEIQPVHSKHGALVRWAIQISPWRGHSTWLRLLAHHRIHLCTPIYIESRCGRPFIAHQFPAPPTANALAGGRARPIVTKKCADRTAHQERFAAQSSNLVLARQQPLIAAHHSPPTAAGRVLAQYVLKKRWGLRLGADARQYSADFRAIGDGKIRSASFGLRTEGTAAQ